MKRALPIYLTPEEYSALHEAAEKYGKPMTEVVRDLIDEHLLAHSRPPTDLSALAGAMGGGHPTDIAANKDQMIEDAIADIYGHKRSLRLPKP